MDDEPDSAKTMARLLMRMGADVETACDGRQAVDVAAAFEPQIVLLDIGLPVMNGYEAGRRIRENASGRAVTLVALTGWDRQEDVRRSQEAGFDRHLVKPVDPAALERLLADLSAADWPPAPGGTRGTTAPTQAAAWTGFVAEMSHEIRTPLNALVGAAHLLLGSPLNEEQRGLVQTLRNSGESLRTIVDDLVDLAGIESGTLVLDETPFRPSALVDECLVLAGPDAAERRLDLSCRVEPSVPAAIIGDAARIRRVTLHLLKIAMRSTAAGGVSVTVSSRPTQDGRFEIHVGVGGTGNGGAPLDALGAAAARRDGPTDFGLGVGRILCGRMGGRMWIEDDAARRSAFHFTFVAPEAPASGLGDPAALRVLVADDDPVSRRLAVLLLSDLDVAADAVADGLEAVSAVSRTAYDAVLLDARMSEMDGVETMREIRRIAPPPLGPRVIAMTASTARSDRESLFAAGADACVTKPVADDALRAALAVVRPGVGRAAAPAILDAEVMKDLRSRGAPDGPGIRDKLIGLFLADTPLQFAKLREAAIRGDAADLERIAHRLRGSSASIGATRLLSHASDVETRARRGDVAAAVAAVEAFEDAWSITRAALEHVRRAPS